MTLDRIDGTKGYTPDNCRWATYREQNRNLRTNRVIDGRKVCELAEELGLSRTAIIYRERQGLPIGAPRINKRTHCKAGHPWTEENTYVFTTKEGTRTHRYCRKCRAKHQADLRARRGK